MRFLFLLAFCLWGFFASAQNDLLAKNYFDQGDYDKAALLYEKLVIANPNDVNMMLNLVKTYQQLERFAEAEKILKDRINDRRINPQLYIELGYNYALQQKDSLAKKEYNRAVDYIKEQPMWAYSLGRVFTDYSLLDEAVTVYTTAMQLNPDRDYYPQLARIYGEQGKLELMFQTYLDLTQSSPSFIPSIQRNFSMYVTEDPSNEANQLLRKALLKKLQEDPNVLYNQLLSWLFVQQKEYKKAFIQEKAIYARNEESMIGMADLAQIAIEDKSYEDAREIVSFIIEKAFTASTKLDAYRQLMYIDLQMASKETYAKIDAEFNKLFAEFGEGPETYLLQIDYNQFLAEKYNQKTKAIENLKALSNKNLNQYEEARVKLKLADILVTDERFNEALIYYSQVQGKVKNDILAQQARFKVARTSYFKGDFEWAQTQLNVLKSSASQLIANDAMQLSLMIRDNSLEDTTQTALKKYATADLKALQGKNEEAIDLLQKLITENKGEAIEDEALLKLGSLYEITGQFEKAIVQYEKLIEFYGEDILADDAYYRLGQLYENKMSDPVKAKQAYETIIFKFEDSIYFVDARKRYRMLRGDEIN